MAPTEPDGGAARPAACLSDILDAALCSANLARFGAGTPPVARRVCTEFPEAASEAGFEVRLAEGAQQVDVGIRLEPSPSFLSTWRVFTARVRDGTALSPAWSGFDAFVSRWTDAASTLATWVPFVFLEVDGISATPLTPSIFVSFDWPLVDAAEWREETARSHAVALESLQLLGGDVAAHEPRIDCCFAALPFDGRVVHAGAMLGRRAAPIRLSVAVARDDFDAYAHAIGIVGADRLSRCIAQLSPELHRIHFEHDIGAARPKFGLVVAETVAEPGSGDVLKAVLERCHARGLCSDERVQAVLSWPGNDVVHRRGAGEQWLLRRSISHVKLELSGAVPEVKAYLAAALDPY